jgi:polysaccharide export outer membrane protein
LHLLHGMSAPVAMVHYRKIGQVRLPAAGDPVLTSFRPYPKFPPSLCLDWGALEALVGPGPLRFLCVDAGIAVLFRPLVDGLHSRCWLFSRTAVGLLLAASCCLASGCASTGGTKFTPKTMPATLMAAKRENAQTVDFSRLASVAPNSELIDRLDVIEVSIATGFREKDNIAQPVRVREDGIADIPVVGPVQVAGLELAEAEAAISAACIQRQLYKNPHVTVTMKHQRTNKVTVVGAVKTPGVYSIPRGQCDLLAALIEAGGLDENAGTMVEIRNPIRNAAPPDPIASNSPDGVSTAGHSLPAATTGAVAPRSSVRVDLVSAAKDGTAAYRVEDGAVVMVEKRDPEPIHVLGLVRNPNRYELPVGQDLSVLNAIALAGGVANPVANKVYVIRKLPNSEQTVMLDVRIANAKRNERDNILLAPGDVVSVEQTPATVMIDTLRIVNFGFGATLPLTALF